MKSVIAELETCFGVSSTDAIAAIVVGRALNRAEAAANAPAPRPAPRPRAPGAHPSPSDQGVTARAGRPVRTRVGYGRAPIGTRSGQ